MARNKYSQKSSKEINQKLQKYKCSPEEWDKWLMRIKPGFELKVNAKGSPYIARSRSEWRRFKPYKKVHADETTLVTESSEKEENIK